MKFVPPLSRSKRIALRPCFERYPNNRLVNVKPFHSEWRMRSEDNCLQFCSDTASRCRSIVYDAVQHICHFFLDDGFDVAVPAAKMIYLRVTSKDCLAGSLSSSEANYVQSQETFEVPDAHSNPVVQAADFTIPPTLSRVEETVMTQTPQTTESTETTTKRTMQPITLLATTVTPVEAALEIAGTLILNHLIFDKD
ncbi:PAN domain protein [Oesophagostomum dentatum]|uniref:PAN domain protein n=1 Tax=Oesophagostomum dentatum TaxID=61180 RepID=A0A0B1TM49_OESDE|nr:PAN domain protein [Oesophagostomum dentatum]